MASTSVAPRLWSTAFYRSVARFLLVGVVTGAVTGVALVVLTMLLSRTRGATCTVEDVAWPVLIAAAVGAVLAVPVALLSSATGLVVAAKAPRRRVLALVLLPVWPTALAVAMTRAWLVDLVQVQPRDVALSGVLLVVLVVAAAVRTHRWVLAPLRGPDPSE